VSGNGLSETTSREIYKPLESNSLSGDINVRANNTCFVSNLVNGQKVLLS